MGWKWALKHFAGTLCFAFALLLLNGCLFGHCAGNGEGYPGCTGVPEGSANGNNPGFSTGGSGISFPTYYEQDPDYSCAPDGGTAQPSYRAAISQENGAYFHLGDSCHPTHQPIVASDLDASYDGTLLGYHEGIYELMDKPGEKPAMHAWCVSPRHPLDSRVRLGTDSDNEQAELYLPARNFSAIFDFQVAFKSDSRSWEFVAPFFELLISRSPSATKPYTHDSVLEFNIYDSDVALEVYCRVLPRP
jgi:hypothetical protein